MHLLDDSGIAGKSPRIEALHLAREFLGFLGRLGIALDQLPQLIQFAQLLLECALRVNRIGRRIVGRGLTARAIGVVARVDIAPHRAVRNLAAGARVAAPAAYITGVAQRIGCATIGVAAATVGVGAGTAAQLLVGLPLPLL